MITRKIGSSLSPPLSWWELVTGEDPEDDLICRNRRGGIRRTYFVASARPIFSH